MREPENSERMQNVGDTDRSETNRQNAAKSTGPKTGLGKARSALNRASHGLRSEATVIPGERAADWRAFAAGIALDLGVDGHVESAAASLIASCIWRLGRVARFEAAAAARAMSRTELIKAHSHSMQSSDDLMFAGGSIIATKPETHRDGLEAIKAEIDWLEACVQLLADLHKYPGRDTVHVDFAEEIGRAAGTAKGWICDIQNRGVCTFADIRKLLKRGHKPLAGVRSGLADRLAAKRSELAEFETQLADMESRFEADLQALAESNVIPNEADMQRMQAYEAHVSRSLARSIEAFRALRELKREADPVRPRIAVASIAKRGKNRKNV